jgi:cell shape-determining protein MreC
MGNGYKRLGGRSPRRRGEKKKIQRRLLELQPKEAEEERLRERLGVQSMSSRSKASTGQALLAEKEKV